MKHDLIIKYASKYIMLAFHLRNLLIVIKLKKSYRFSTENIKKYIIFTLYTTFQKFTKFIFFEV